MSVPGGGAGSSLDREGRALVERLGGHWTANGGLCRCPAHDDRSPSLSVRPGRSRLLLHCFAGCAAEDVLRVLASGRLIEPGARVRAGTPGVGSNSTGARTAALRLWGSARDIAGSPAETYLRLRGLEASVPNLRFHPRTPHGPKPLTRFRPAMIAAIRDETGLVAVQRTFLGLHQRQVTPRPDLRCGLGPFGCGAVRLGGAAPRLGLAEGIETALSASALFRMPCWAALGTERFALVALPPEVTELLLFLDNDAGGRRAEALARQAYPHVPSVEAHYPGRAGADWNDVLREGLPGGTDR
jgi:hypothetical protein